MALPVAIWETYIWLTIPITAGIAFFLLGIEHIGEPTLLLLSCADRSWLLHAACATSPV